MQRIADTTASRKLEFTFRVSTHDETVQGS